MSVFEVRQTLKRQISVVGTTPVCLLLALILHVWLILRGKEHRVVFQTEAFESFDVSFWPIGKRDFFDFKLGDAPRDHRTHVGVLSVELLISNPGEHMCVTQSDRVLQHLML